MCGFYCLRFDCTQLGQTYITEKKAMTSKPKILVTYIESGFGHIMSAQAIADGLKAKYGTQMDIVESEIMRDDNDETLIKFEKFLTNQTKATNKYWHYGDLIFAVMNLGRRQFMNLVHHVFFRKAVNSAVEAFRLREPDVIISTHYFVTFCAMEYKRRYAKEHDVTVISYNPDNNVHVWWDRRCDVFITNNGRASTEAIRKRKFDYSHVRQVYFTVRKCIRQFDMTKQQCRDKYGIAQDKFCIMIADGGYALSKSKKYCKYLLKHIKQPLTILFLAGKNQALYDEFCQIAQTAPSNITLIPLRFTEKIYELYCACDLFVTKAGPNSILDSLFVGTPVMVDYCPHPIERATCKLFVKDYGCGVTAFHRRTATKLINSYISDPSLLDPCRKAIAEHIDKTVDGGEQIADIVYEQVKHKFETETTQANNK